MAAVERGSNIAAVAPLFTKQETMTPPARFLPATHKTGRRKGMSDMRDIGRVQEPVESSFAPRANPDFRSEKISLEGEGLENGDIRPLDENSIMGAFHTPEPEVSTNTGKLAGALAVALILGSAGVFAYTTGMHAQKPVSNAALPHPAAPPKVAAAAPPAPLPTPPAASDNSQQAAMATPTAPVSEPSKPVKTARLHTERSHLRKRRDDMTPASPTPEQSAMAQPSAPIVPTPQQSASAQPAPQQSAQTQPSSMAGANQATVLPPVSPIAPSSSYANNVPAPVITPDNGAAQVTPAPQPVVPETTPSPQTATPEAQATPSPLPAAPETQAQNQATPQPAPTQSNQSGQIAPEQNPPQQQQAQ
jgi:hypothetical protein